MHLLANVSEKVSVLVVPEIPNITAGDTAVLRFTLTINSQNVGSSTDVRARITDLDKEDLTLSPIVTCTYAAPVAPATLGTWTATFSGSDTRGLLSDPTNLASRLKKSILKHENKAYLEVQVGSPYDPWTGNVDVLISKGLI